MRLSSLGKNNAGLDVYWHHYKSHKHVGRLIFWFGHIESVIIGMEQDKVNLIC